MKRASRIICVLAAIALPLIAGAEASGPNLLENPGFEQLDDSGWPVGWSERRPVFSVSEDVARTGERSLRWDNDDPERYILCGHAVELERGYRYEFETWVRTEDLGGSGHGATVCMEWWDDEGTYIGGSYPTGRKGDTPEWTLIRGITPPIPQHAASINLTVYVRRGGVGTAWFDDCSVRRYRPPLTDAITTDLYRGITSGGTVRAHVGMSPRDWELEPGDIEATLEVRDAAGASLRTVRPHGRTETTLLFEFSSRDLRPGDYELVATVGTADGEVEESLSTTMTRTDGPPERRAWIDEHQRLIVDGKPFFPLGTYWNRVSPHPTSLVDEHLDIYAESAFNCIMPYDSTTIDEARLDACHERGISVIFSVKDFYAGRRGLETEEDARRLIEQYVDRFAYHPAIIAWYTNDEMPATMYPQLRAHQLWMEELDPERPTWIVLYQVDEVGDYLGTFDVIGTDPYPIPTHPPYRALSYTERTIEGTLGLKPVWMVPQIFNWASYRDDSDDYRPPTLEEMRSMAWQCIAGGANGLVFYSWMDLWRVEQKGMETFESRWPDVKQMAAEISQFEQMLLSVEPAMQPRVEKPLTVGWRVYGMGGRTYLVAVNADRRPVDLSFEFPREIATHEVLFRNPRVRVEGDTVHLRLGGLEPTVIALTPGGDARRPWDGWRERWRARAQVPALQ
ncbi:MAG: hypothetical protein ACOX9R_17125 [Armatimonadota bacterium]